MTYFRIPVAALTTLMALFLFAVTAAQAATGEKRVALVIGNSSYKHTAPLKNPKNDATAVAESLRRLDFEVIEGIDLDLNGMREKVREFTASLEGSRVALFYYAGHGFQINGNNHLAPIDATLNTESDIDFETLPLNFILRQMEREKNRTNLVFLDACRDNPLATQLSRSLRGQGRSVSMSRGLARVESGVGMLISYATSPGTVALDGDGNHSPYTKALLKYIEQANLSVSDMMIAVRQDVLADTTGKQVPWENSSLTGKYYFKTKAKTSTATPVTQTARDESRAGKVPGRTSKDVAEAYRATVAIGSCGAYKIFEEQHRGTFYGRLAEEYLRENCKEGDKKDFVTAMKDEKSPAEPIPQPNNATPPAETKATGDEQNKRQIIVVAKKEEGDTPGTGETVQQEQVLEKQPEDPGAMTASIQRELDRIGCRPGPVDGKWGGQTSRAISRFNGEVNKSYSTSKPTEELLTTLKEQSGTVCKVVATPPPAVNRQQAVAPKPRVVKPKPKVVKKKKAPKRDEYWGGEDTRIDCEVKGIWTADCFKQK